MLVLEESVSPTVVFTADFAGLYSVVAYVTAESGSGAMYLGSRQILGPSPGPDGWSSAVVWLNASDELLWEGPAGTLHGFRIGDEM